MPKGKIGKTPHLAWTDHRIRANPKQPEMTAPIPPSRDLEAFFGEKVIPRDLALAYYDLVAGGDLSQREKAWTQLLEAYKILPKDLPVLKALGYLAQMRGEKAQAINFYREALALDPLEITSMNNLGTLLAKSGDLQAAETLWGKTFSLNEDVDEPGINLAAVDCMLGKKDQAEQVLRRVLFYSPDRAIARQKLRALESGREICATR